MEKKRKILNDELCACDLSAPQSFQGSEVDPVPSPDEVDPVPSPDEVDPVPSPDEVDPVPSPDEVDPVPSPDDSEPDSCPDDSEPDSCPDDSEPVPCPDDSEPVPCPDDSEPVPCPDDSEPVPCQDDSEPVPCPDDSEPVPCPDDSELHCMDNKRQYSFPDLNVTDTPLSDVLCACDSLQMRSHDLGPDDVGVVCPTSKKQYMAARTRGRGADVICSRHPRTSIAKKGTGPGINLNKCNICETKLARVWDGKTYKPIPYIIRLPVNARAGAIQNPPFDVLLDHTIAVIWRIFSIGNEKFMLDIPQLQWALQFLKSLVDSNGVCPPDICLSIEAIENRLLNQYAAFDRTPTPIKKCRENDDAPCREDIGKHGVQTLIPSVTIREMAERNPTIGRNYSLNFSNNISHRGTRPLGPGTYQIGSGGAGLARLDVPGSTRQNAAAGDKNCSCRKCECCKGKLAYGKYLVEWRTMELERIKKQMETLDKLGKFLGALDTESCKTGVVNLLCVKCDQPLNDASGSWRSSGPLESTVPDAEGIPDVNAST